MQTGPENLGRSLISREKAGSTQVRTVALTNQLWSLVIRVASLAGKAGIMLVLAKEMTVEAYGQFGLIAVTIGFAIYLLGFEFYTHSVRNIVGTAEKDIETYIRDHFVFIFLGYLLWLPLAYTSAMFGAVPVSLILEFYALLIIEHLSAEIYRYLVAIKKPVSASISFFLRNASWAYAMTALIYGGVLDVGVAAVLHYWIAGSFASVLFGAYRLDLRWGNFFGKRIDWNWIRKGMYVGSGFLAGTLLLRATGIVDRYLIHFYLGDYSVGIYTLYVSIVGIVSTFFESGLLMHAFPGILEAHKDGNVALYRTRLRTFFRQSVWVSIALIAGAFALFHVLIGFEIIKPEYGEESGAFLVMLLSVFVKNVSFTPHYGLYVNGVDSKILTSSAAGFVAEVALCVLLIPVLGLLGAATAVFSANALILLLKTRSYFLHDANKTA